MQRKAFQFLGFFFVVFCYLGQQGALSQDDFYKGKTIRFIVGFSAGGGFDAYSRAIARHIGKHIPGNPSVIVENMGGAGSLIAANHLYNNAKPDGVTIGNWIGGMVLQERLGQKGINFESDKFEWIGAPVKIHDICLVNKASGINSEREWLAAKKPLKLGGSAPGSTSADIPNILAEYTKFPIQLVKGYKGVSDVRLAVEAAEVDGGCWSWEGTKSQWQAQLQRGDIKVILQIVPKRHPDLPNVPLAIDFIKSQEGRDVLKAAVHDLGIINRPYSLPPGTPKDRVQILRKAFMTTMNDPEFLEDAKKAKLDIDPVSGEEVEHIVLGLKNLSPDVKEKLKGIILPK